MTLAKNKLNIPVTITTDMKESIERAWRSGQVRNRNEWMRQAILAKLAETPEDERLAAIVGLYQETDEEGRAWLHQAALMARECHAAKL